MIWGYQNILAQKSHTRKIDIINEDFELYNILNHNVLWQNVGIFPLYILLTRTDIFWSTGID